MCVFSGCTCEIKAESLHTLAPVVDEDLRPEAEAGTDEGGTATNRRSAVCASLLVGRLRARKIGATVMW